MSIYAHHITDIAPKAFQEPMFEEELVCLLPNLCFAFFMQDVDLYLVVLCLVSRRSLK